MKDFILIFFILITSIGYSQSCDDLLDFVKSESYGTTYHSYTSDAISKVTFYTVNVDYKTLYFAVVCFKREYSYGCDEYLYQVGSNTKLNYSVNYLDSAGKAFWNYIQPYSDVLDCSPNF